MKILLCNNTMAMLAGSELVTYNIAKKLKERKHKVTIYSPKIGGVLWDKCKENDIFVTPDLREVEEPDVVHAHHHDPTKQVLEKFPNVPVVFTLHGIIGGPESAPKELVKRGERVQFVAVSEEVRALIQHLYSADAEIIRQGIDLDRFKPQNPINKEIKTALLSTSYMSPEHSFVKQLKKAMDMIGVRLAGIGKDYNWTWETEKAYNNADIVFAIGRGVLEAMACNRPAFLYGHWGQSGILDKEKMDSAKQFNFSGRDVRYEFLGWKDILKELEAYQPRKNYRKLVNKDYDLNDKVNQYIKLYEKVAK
jgi:glycosyltransferase involved in cell wall biosynthesis